jgi:hypothetical protein
MFPNVRLLLAAMISSVVALSCGFGIFAALRVNHEPLARLPSGSAPLQLLASISPSPPIAVAAVEPIERGLRAGDTSGGTGLADAPARAPAASDREADTSSPEPETSSAVAGNPSATAPVPAQEAPASAAEHEADPPDADATSQDSTPAPVPTSSVAAIEAPPEQSVLIEPEEPDGVLAPASVPPAAETAASKGATKAAATSAKNKSAKKKTAHTHVAARTRTRRPRLDGIDGFAGSNTAGSNTAGFNAQESAIGGPFVSPAAW